MGLIESEKLITDIQGIASEVCMKSPYDPEWFTRLHNRQSEIIRIIEMQPKVDAEPVRHGRWLSAYEYAIKVGVTDMERLEEAKKDNLWKFCNDCEQQVKGFYNYCPNCGAKMDEEVK